MFRWLPPALLAWAACRSLFHRDVARGGAAATGARAGRRARSRARAACGHALAAHLRSGGLRLAGGFRIGAAVPAGLRLLALGALALIYPLNTGAMRPCSRRRRRCRLARVWCRCRPRRVLDAGCGLATACASCIASTRRRSLPAWNGAGRCVSPAPGAAPSRASRARPGASDWSQDLVYLFQRPESMPRALTAPRAAPGRSLASLNSEAPEGAPAPCRCRAGAKLVWLYRALL